MWIVVKQNSASIIHCNHIIHNSPYYHQHHYPQFTILPPTPLSTIHHITTNTIIHSSPHYHQHHYPQFTISPPTPLSTIHHITTNTIIHNSPYFHQHHLLHKNIILLVCQALYICDNFTTEDRIVASLTCYMVSLNHTKCMYIM